MDMDFSEMGLTEENGLKIISTPRVVIPKQLAKEETMTLSTKELVEKLKEVTIFYNKSKEVIDDLLKKIAILENKGGVINDE